MDAAVRRNKTNKNKNKRNRNRNTARKMLSRKVRRYFDGIQEELHAGHKLPAKLRDYIQRLIVEDMSNDANNRESFDHLLLERVKER